MPNGIVRALAVGRMTAHDQRVIVVGGAAQRHRAARGEANRTEAGDVRVEERVGTLRPHGLLAAFAGGPAQHEHELAVAVAEVLERVELGEVVGERVELAEGDVAARPDEGGGLAEDEVLCRRERGEGKAKGRGGGAAFGEGVAAVKSVPGVGRGA